MARSKSSAFGHGVLALIVIAALAFAIEFAMRSIALLQGAELVVDDRVFAWAADRLPSQHSKIALVLFTDETDDGSQIGGARVTNRGELARLITAVDAAGARAIGIDILFLKATTPADDDALVQAARSARASIVFAVADERVGLAPGEVEFQDAFLARIARKAGFVNLRTEQDGVIRYTAGPNPAGKWADSFAGMLVKEVKAGSLDGLSRRIAWLSAPADGTDTFLTLPASIVLAGGDNPALATLKDRIVLIGRFAAFQDRHRTPISGGAFDLMPGVAIHAHIGAQLFDARSLIELPPISRVIVIAISALFGYWAGLRFRISHAGCFLKTLALVALVGIHLLAFSQFRVFIPATAMLFGFVGALFIGDYVGQALDRRWLTWLGLHPTRRAGII